ncbi:hypothetical protein ACNPQK_14520 [Acinetobacter guillouiae]|jgi:hypothetical protein|uniref:Lipoprotein n=2 Tax=Acinetobacter guillouiae TaxID=106649 RepID=N8Y9K3_ACIGI|nr:MULTISPECIES: hypothetical protein [Acinetobacter]MDN5490326.1 hypothetical protein [Acinetobacter sp.]ENU59495.1 hypothetical protein F981_01593 [Acinetobacter guillouiae CIP 63.46]ENV16333.1 hypothetical protein F964_03268 [Acinetobacter guillouiae NIPH 991]EPH31181.1 hypothetical protein L291_3697 [Acinetobacter guillouiae MSP4-18]KAB0627899.1 hypothetical protein F7P82_07130 [Acinetobacter guillouiae]
MKLLRLIPILALGTILTACGGMPKECEESWKHMEDLAKQSGIPEDSLKEQKKAFEEEIKKLSKEDAIQACKAQSSIIGMVK